MKLGLLLKKQEVWPVLSFHCPSSLDILCETEAYPMGRTWLAT